MKIGWIKRLAAPLLVMAALSACQSPYYERGYARPVYAAAPTCDSYDYAPPRECYQRPRYKRSTYYREAYQPPVRVRKAAQYDCAPVYDRPARSSYRSARAPRNCSPAAPVRQPRGYRYVGERPALTCGPIDYGDYRRYRPVRESYRTARYRAPRQSYRSRRDTTCCY